MVGVGCSVRGYVCAVLLSTREGNPSKGGCICTPLTPPFLDPPLCGGLMYADDIVLLAETGDELQEMLDVVGHYGVEVLFQCMEEQNDYSQSK